MRQLLFIFVGLALLPCRLLLAEADYLRDIKPVLKARCYACHGALKQKAGLRLDTAEFIIQGAKSGAIVSSLTPDESELLLRLRTADLDDRMPPEGEALSGDEIASIQSWIEAGLPLPESESPEKDPDEHWAFQAPIAPSIPIVKREGIRSRNPIDLLIGQRQEQLGITALPPASSALLLRRLSLDLIGLPPSLDERDRLLNAKEPDAYERLVDRLLSSPQYGERWGRHWMDIWRYSDWYGLGAQLRNSQKHLWHWRDWIIESLNDDKGYDRMVVEMIAGDEVAPTDPDILRATGFLARNYYLFNRNTWLEQTIEHTSQAFLGLTMQCAKCHDHKYDPISQVDYYQFRAFFEPHQIRLDPIPGETDLEKDGLPRAFDAHQDTPTYLFKRGNDKNPDETKALVAKVPRVLEWEALDVQSQALPAEAYFPGLQTFVLQDHLRDAESGIQKAEDLLEERLEEQTALATTASSSESHGALELAIETAQLKLKAAKLLPIAHRSIHRADRVQHGLEADGSTDGALKAANAADQRWQLARAEAEVAQKKWELAKAEEKKMSAAEKALEKSETALLELQEHVESGSFKYTSLRPSRKALESPAETDESRRLPYETSSTGRRTALAKWMIDPRHPLTARVAVNHIWLRHFGQPLVEDVTDFGRRSASPPMQELLDYLAKYLIVQEWRMKPLHRLIVTSEAYRRMSSTQDADEASLRMDPDNQFYWRRLPVRMESQVVRDSMRYLASDLDLRMGGPTVDPTGGEGPARRSLYFTHSRDQQHLFLSMFDDAEILACYRRTESIIPQQALALVNSKMALELAGLVARRLENEVVSKADSEFVVTAFRFLLGVPPSEAESNLCLEMLERTRNELSDLPTSQQDFRSRRNLVQVLFNHNDFITIR
jgi:hypothetical protein